MATNKFNAMSEREKFEAWAGQFFSKGLIEDMAWEWKAWQAAKADVPEGCTPADAEKLRKFNHDLALENSRLKEILASLTHH